MVTVLLQVCAPGSNFIAISPFSFDTRNKLGVDVEMEDCMVVEVDGFCFLGLKKNFFFFFTSFLFLSNPCTWEETFKVNTVHRMFHRETNWEGEFETHKLSNCCTFIYLRIFTCHKVTLEEVERKWPDRRP